MKQLASANVKCVVSEGNKDIIKRTLSAEFELDKNNKDDPQWKGNELEFNLGVYKIHVTIDVMPDFRGYLIMARGEENKGCMGWLGIVAFVFVFLFFRERTEEIWNPLWASFILMTLCCGLWSTVAGWIAKLKMRSVFKKVSRVLN